MVNVFGVIGIAIITALVFAGILILVDWFKARAEKKDWAKRVALWENRMETDLALMDNDMKR